MTNSLRNQTELKEDVPGWNGEEILDAVTDALCLEEDDNVDIVLER